MSLVPPLVACSSNVVAQLSALEECPSTPLLPTMPQVPPPITLPNPNLPATRSYYREKTYFYQ